MKKLLKTVLITGATASIASLAEAQYANGDLVIGFTKGVTDIVFDLGTPASVGVGGLTTVNLSTRISASLLNSSYVNDLGNLSLGVVGENSTGPSGSQRSIYSTVMGGALAPNRVPNSSSWNVISLNIDSAGSAIDGSGNPANSAVVDNSAGTGLSFTENITSTSGNTFAKNYGDPTTQTPSPFTSSTITEDLYVAFADNSAPQLLGTFTFGSDASLTFTPVAVPEPTACAIMFGGGLLVLGLRRRFIKKV